MLNLTDDELRRLRGAAAGRPLTAFARALLLRTLAQVGQGAPR